MNSTICISLSCLPTVIRNVFDYYHYGKIQYFIKFNVEVFFSWYSDKVINTFVTWKQAEARKIKYFHAIERQSQVPSAYIICYSYFLTSLRAHHSPNVNCMNWQILTGMNLSRELKLSWLSTFYDIGKQSESRVEKLCLGKCIYLILIFFSTIFQIKLNSEVAMVLLNRIRNGSIALRLGEKTFLLKNH